MNPIASLFAELGFRVNRKGLTQFQNDLKDVQRKINNTKPTDLSFRYNSGAAGKIRNDLDGIAKSSREVSKNDPFKNYGKKAKRNIYQVRREFLATTREMNDVMKGGLTTDSQRAAFKKLHRERIALAQEYTSVKKKHFAQNNQELTQLNKIARSHDRHGFQLKQLQDQNRFINEQYRKGNISLERRDRILSSIAAKEASIRRSMETGTRVGAAGGVYAGGEDPRQVGNHRIISAIHSDAGLGAMMGGFAAAQSVRAYQGVVAMEQGLTAATGSAERAGEEMEFLIGLSQKLGLYVGDLGQSFASFAAAARGSSMTSQDVRNVFEGVSAQARVLNLSAADTQGVMTAVTQIMNKSTVMAEELKNQLGKSNCPV